MWRVTTGVTQISCAVDFDARMSRHATMLTEEPSRLVASSHEVTSLKSLKEAFVTDHSGTDHFEIVQLVLLVPVLTSICQCLCAWAPWHGRSAGLLISAEFLLIVLPATLSVMTSNLMPITITAGVAACTIAYYQWIVSIGPFSDNLQQLAEQPRKRCVRLALCYDASALSTV